MGMSMAFGKMLMYKGGKKDAIGLDTEVTYQDQNGRRSKLNMRKFVEKAKKCKKHKALFDSLIKDITENNLLIGFPVIEGLNYITEELGKEVFEILEVKQ